VRAYNYYVRESWAATWTEGSMRRTNSSRAPESGLRLEIVGAVADTTHDSQGKVARWLAGLIDPKYSGQLGTTGSNYSTHPILKYYQMNLRKRRCNIWISSYSCFLLWFILLFVHWLEYFYSSFDSQFYSSFDSYFKSYFNSYFDSYFYSYSYT